MSEERDEVEKDGLREALPGLARIYASSWLNTAEWAVRSGIRLANAVAGRESASEPLDDGADEIRGSAGTERESSVAALRAQGEELLRRSADVDDDEDTHPAYERILGELAPDEARILRLFMVEGPQPAVDVRAGLPLASELVAPGRNMIGADAGCRYPERVPAYLNNLSRLGLIWFSREPIRDRLRYQVVEAQPDVLAALRKGGRTARTVRRSILLTPFGHDFCDMVLPLDTAEFEAASGDGAAADGDGADPPSGYEV
jgi:hypothetical protein